MNNANPSQSVPAVQRANTFPVSHDAAVTDVCNGSFALHSQEVCPESLSDESREAAILRARTALQKHEARWHAEGCFAAKGDADRARSLLERLIAGRRA